MPGAVVSGVQNALTSAGATVTGQVQLQSQFFSTGTESDLDTLNRQLTPAGVTPHSGSPQAAAAALIASAILTKDGPAQPLTGNAASADQADPQRLRGGRLPEHQREPGRLVPPWLS